MNPTAIFAALGWECQPVLRRLRQVRREQVGPCVAWWGQAGRRDVWVIRTGIGPKRAAAAAEAATGIGSFGLFMSTGCAGALVRDLVPGDMAVATRVVVHGSADQFESDPHERERVRRSAERATLRTVLGPMVCSPIVLATAAAKAAAAADGGLAVEMESGPIAACAGRMGVPFVAVRAILDNAETELRHAGRFVNATTGGLKPLALARFLTTHPTALPDLLAVQKMMWAARTSLNRFFEAWLTDGA